MNNNTFSNFRLLCLFTVILSFVDKNIADPNSLSLPQEQIWMNVVQPDSTRFNAIKEYYNKNLYTQPDSIISLSACHIDLAQEKKSEKQKAIALYNKAIAYSIKSEYDKSLSAINEAVEIYTSLNDSTNLIKSYNVLAIVYARRIEYHKAIQYYSKCLAFYEENKNDKEQAKVLVNLGLIYFGTHNYDLALDYYYQANNLLDKNELENKTGIIWLNIAQVNLKKKDFQLAIKNSKRALKLFQQEDQFYIAYYHTVNARIYLELNQLNIGLDHIEKARELHQEVGNDFLYLEDQIIKAKLHYPTDVDKAITIGEEALKTIDNDRDYSLRLELYQALYKSYKKKGESGLALSMLERYNTASDNFLARKNQVAITRKLIQDDYESKMYKKQFESEQTQSQLKLNQLKKTFVLFFITALVVLFIMFYTRSKRMIHNKEREGLVNKIDHLKELEHTRNKLIQSDKMASLGQLTAGVAHEINNPVNFISSGVIGLKKTVDEYIKTPKGEVGEELVEDINNMIQAIEEGAKRTNTIVKSLRLFSRADTENYIKSDVISGLESTLTLLSNKIENDIFLEKDFEKKELPIFCFPGQLNQVFMNILLNAIQALEGAGTIKVKVEDQEENVVISISDNGVGIPDDKKQKIFEPFYTTKSIQEGTGLGLSISFGIIKKHKGTIEVKDNSPKGTQFIIQLPKKDDNLLIEPKGSA